MPKVKHVKDACTQGHKEAHHDSTSGYGCLLLVWGLLQTLPKGPARGVQLLIHQASMHSPSA